jgi:uncharacterized membrane protein YbhN (UPF0104 family)
VSLLAWLGWRTDWQQVGDAFRHLRVEWWLAAVALYVVTQGVSSLRWQLLARPLGFTHSLARCTAFYFIGMYFNLFLPTSVGGDVVRAVYLNGGSGRRLNAFLSVFLDRFTGLLILLALACVAVAASPVDLPPWIPLSVWGTAACAVAGLVMLPPLARGVGKFDRVRRLSEGVRLYRQEPGLLLNTAALSVFVQAANVVVVWLVGVAVGADVPASYYWVLVPMVSLLTLLPVSLNGMGVREGGMVVFLTPLGIGEGTAMTLAFLWFSVFTVTSLLGGAVYLFGWFPRPEERSDHECAVRGDPDQGREGQLKTAA